jgi:hypothetical protein
MAGSRGRLFRLLSGALQLQVCLAGRQPRPAMNLHRCSKACSALPSGRHRISSRQHRSRAQGRHHGPAAYPLAMATSSESARKASGPSRIRKAARFQAGNWRTLRGSSSGQPSPGGGPDAVAIDRDRLRIEYYSMLQGGYTVEEGTFRHKDASLFIRTVFARPTRNISKTSGPGLAKRALIPSFVSQ